MLGDLGGFVYEWRHSRRLETVVNLLHGSHLLDIGCGHGRNMRYPTSKGVSVCGLDVSLNKLECARSALLESGVYGLVDLVVADADEGLPFRDNAFGGVLDVFTFTFIKSKRRYLEEVSRILKNEGLFLLEFDMSPHILSHEELRSFLELTNGLFNLVEMGEFYHEWGRISNECKEEVPAVYAIGVKNLS